MSLGKIRNNSRPGHPILGDLPAGYSGNFWYVIKTRPVRGVRIMGLDKVEGELRLISLLTV